MSANLPCRVMQRQLYTSSFPPLNLIPPDFPDLSKERVTRDVGHGVALTCIRGVYTCSFRSSSWAQAKRDLVHPQPARSIFCQE